MNSSWAYKQMSSQPRIPFPGQGRSNSVQYEERRRSSPAAIPFLPNSTPTREETFRYLEKLLALDPENFEDFIIENYRPETLLKWVAIKNAYIEESAALTADELVDSTGDFQSRNLRTKAAVEGYGNSRDNLHEKVSRT